MNDMTAEIPPDFSKFEGAALLAAILEKPEAVLEDEPLFERVYETLEAEMLAHEPDLSTDTSRKRIATVANKATPIRTAIDRARKARTADWRARTIKINEIGGKYWERLECLQDKARKPLTDWEEADKARVAECEDTLARLRASIRIAMEDTAADLEARLEWVRGINDLVPERYGVHYELAEAARKDALEALGAGIARLKREEAERAELAELRAQSEAREARDRADREAAEFERTRPDREQAAKQMAEAAEAEARRRADAAREEGARQERQRIEQEQVATKAKQEAAEAAAKLAEQRKANNQTHQRRVNTEAVSALVAHASLTEDQAKLVVTAIVREQIPAVRIAY